MKGRGAFSEQNRISRLAEELNTVKQQEEENQVAHKWPFYHKVIDLRQG
jgi:hypothetical protein